ncbi:hypothetical protein [Arenimonas donghaensis]|uniref:Uncharacterized protein n=1 Tax=Arenimonas donghaensis DSM 18148 = HO3-R19 TaxID=1121014 RepID=A0A087MJT0_9GAMM|nr:hypothetical protein [Arenimonas donghaensis]KFL37133.1 hypothetical protein N788_11445 [Arenimonas donghaensis DSM 18148 = HO3-R19]
MKSFWLLLGMAFVDLAIAGAMTGRGERGLALLFMGLAVVMAAFALFGKPELRRDPRGRLQEVDPPFAKLLGGAGALAILVAAGYVAVSTSRPEPAPLPQRPAPAVLAASGPAESPEPDLPPAHRPPAGNWLHKCVDSAGLASFQSAPCPADSREAWRRAVTPEHEPVRPRVRLATRPRVQYTQTSPGNSSRRKASEDAAACQAAREADRRYRAQPLRLVTHDGLRRHGDAIRDACD